MGDNNWNYGQSNGAYQYAYARKQRMPFWKSHSASHYGASRAYNGVSHSNGKWYESPAEQDKPSKPWHFCSECVFWCWHGQFPCCPCGKAVPVLPSEQPVVGKRTYSEVVAGAAAQAPDSVEAAKSALATILESPGFSTNPAMVAVIKQLITTIEQPKQAALAFTPQQVASLAKVRAEHLHRAQNRQFNEERKFYRMVEQRNVLFAQLEALQSKLEVQKSKVLDTTKNTIAAKDLKEQIGDEADDSHPMEEEKGDDEPNLMFPQEWENLEGAEHVGTPLPPQGAMDPLKEQEVRLAAILDANPRTGSYGPTPSTSSRPTPYVHATQEHGTCIVARAGELADLEPTTAQALANVAA
jgi:hypothetical protein